MALSIQVAGASFANVLASLGLPDRAGLVGEWVLGTDEAKSIVNRANPSGPSMTVVGTPTYGAGYARVMSGPYGNRGFDTGLTLAGNSTIIVVWKKNTACPTLVYAQGGGTYEGFINYSNVPSLYNSQSGTLSNVANIAVPSHTDYSFMAGLMPRGGLGKIYSYAEAELTTNVAEVNGGVTPAGASLKIGTTITNGGAGIADVAYAAVFNRLLDDDEIAAAYETNKAYLALRGLVVS